MDLTAMTSKELNELSARIAAEWERRRASHITDKTVADIIIGLQDSGKLAGPESGTDAENAKPWVNPGTDHSAMYRQGDYVIHQGRTWLSRHPGLNHWEPGAPGIDGRIWLDVTDDLIDSGEPDDPLEYPEWKPGVTYSAGDVIVYQGISYEVTQGHTSQEGWEPPSVPSLFKAI